MDEVGNLAPETQQMLLRAIQERRYRPIGDRADKSFNIRIIAATNENLEKAVNEKRFRQDNPSQTSALNRLACSSISSISSK